MTNAGIITNSATMLSDVTNPAILTQNHLATIANKRLVRQHVRATFAARKKSLRSRLFYSKNTNSGYSFLVDTGAQISVIPPKPNMSIQKTPYVLQAANGSHIETFGETSLTLDLGLRR